ncbi:MAG: polyphosphate kinase 2 family protein [Chloroflexi bacterium]|nr:polyphosphate kinase 2 family protein [Ardenticatenaceae bacterium]MBL1129653.1 polyphosphate kinase 2 family protein [Chloroflexota bacterium]NOG35733.1 polyphosphate kinase 2 family protein [Chloroflexota bacterium]
MVPPGKKIKLTDYDPGYTAGFANKKEAKEALLEDVTELSAAQELIWASGQYAVLIIFQALDAAGKDGTIKHVMSGVNPQGVDVTSFRAPTDEERKHHFLMRPMRKLPEHGRIAIFNRSYYEEVLVVRVHPDFLYSQWRPQRLHTASLDEVWRARYQEINEFEDMVARADTLILKFFLNVSKEEQRQRFLDRLNDPAKQWKFAVGDYHERQYWEEYQQAYEEMLRATSTETAPWYVIPADHKWFMRACVADIITARIHKLHLPLPVVSEEKMAELTAVKQQIEAEAET